MKKAKTLLTTLLLGAIVSISPLATAATASASTQRNSLNIEVTSPERPAWSWAAALESVTKYFSPDSTVTQEGIVKSVTPNNLDKQISKNKIDDAASYCDLSRTYSTKKIAFTKMMSSINNSSPIVGFYSGSDDIMHGMIIYGYRYSTSHKDLTCIDISSGNVYTTSYGTKLFGALPLDGHWEGCLYNMKARS